MHYFFFDFDGVISQEVVQDIVIDLAFQGLVVPGDIEGEHDAVVRDVLLQTVVGMSSSEFDFKILFIFLGIRRVDFQILLSFIHLKIIAWQRLSSGHRLLHVFIEFSGEIVAVVDTEHAFEETDVLLHAEILPEVVVGATDFLGHALTVDEDALSDARVDHARLGKMDGVVIQIIVQNTRTDAVVFQLTLDNTFLEVAEEAEYFAVIFEPAGLDTGNIIVLRLLARLLEGNGWLGAHSIEQLGVEFFF